MHLVTFLIESKRRDKNAPKTLLEMAKMSLMFRYLLYYRELS